MGNGKLISPVPTRVHVKSSSGELQWKIMAEITASAGGNTRTAQEKLSRVLVE
jgi:hypothetical protein